MLSRFPPPHVNHADRTFLTVNGQVFAKLKIESKAGKRTVFLTEHTLIFVTTGIKLLHLPDGTIEAGPDSVVLLKKGIYVMAEYIEEGLHFEALMLFLPAKLLRSFAMEHHLPAKPAAAAEPCLVFSGSDLIDGFKEQLRKYFDKPLLHTAGLLALKQQEILWLLMAAGHRNRLAGFIAEAISTEPESLDFIVRNYLLQPVTVEDLANLSNRSLASFKRDFRRIYNAAPRQWINEQRLAHARMLLANTSMQVAEIAQECGFDSSSYFIRIFKKQYGHTPQALRAETAMD